VRFPSFLRLFAAVSLLVSFQAWGGVVAEIPVEYRGGYLWLKVDAAGRSEPLNFVLDSGAASSVLDISAARRLGAKFGRRVAVQGVHSRTTARLIERFEAQAAGFSLPKSVLAVDLSAVSKTCDRPIDGLLGADFFRDRIVQIDFDAMAVRLLDHAQPSARCTVLPMKARNGTFCVPVSVAENPSQWMRVDTGCDSALEWVVNRTRTQRHEDTSIGLTSARARSISANVQLGDCALQGVKTGIHERPMFTGESGLVGIDLLSRFRVTLDAPGNRLLLESR
jgi:predicted aspartyl protease